MRVKPGNNPNNTNIPRLWKTGGERIYQGRPGIGLKIKMIKYQINPINGYHQNHRYSNYSGGFLVLDRDPDPL